MSYVYSHGVYDYVTIKECLEITGGQPVDTRWLDTNKGDALNPVYRSRWVAKQFRRSWIETAFAATPNVEAIRLLLAEAASRMDPVYDPNNSEEIVILIVDIKR